MWQHHTRRTKFCLCVDSFAVKYFNEEEAAHLINALKNACDITIDRGGTRFCSLYLKWNYTQQFVDISMPNYILKMLEKLQHNSPTRPQHAPHKWVERQYGSHSQAVHPEDDVPPLSEIQKNYIQRVVDCCLYYERAVDSTILSAVNELSMQQANPTERTTAKTKCSLITYIPIPKPPFDTSPVI